MKKIFAVSLILLGLISTLCGCSNSNNLNIEDDIKEAFLFMYSGPSDLYIQCYDYFFEATSNFEEMENIVEVGDNIQDELYAQVSEILQEFSQSITDNKIQVSQNAIAHVFDIPSDELEYIFDEETWLDSDGQTEAIASYFGEDFSESYRNSYQSLSEELSFIHMETISKDIGISVSDIKVELSSDGITYTYTATLIFDNSNNTENNISGSIQFNEENEITYMSVIGFDYDNYIQ